MDRMNNIEKQTEIRRERANQVQKGMESVTNILLEQVELLPFLVAGMTQMGEEITSLKQRLDAIDPRKTGGKTRKHRRSKRQTRARK
jgi:hypothetical protein